MRSTTTSREIDYDQPGSDTAEFVELYNAGSSSVNLGGFSLELVNGTGGGASIYNTIALPSVTLAAGDYFVICANAATAANCDLDGSPNTNFIQNGAPDAVCLRDGVSVLRGRRTTGSRSRSWGPRAEARWIHPETVPRSSSAALCLLNTRPPIGLSLEAPS